MKKLTYLATLAGGLLLATSCVDLDQEPQSFITEEDYIASMDQTALESAVTALYNNLWHDNYGFNSRIQRIQVCADEITYRVKKAGNQLAYYDELRPNITANAADFDTTWELFYLVINNANKLINKAVIPEDDPNTDVNESTNYKGVLAEAYFLRGLSYFYLVRMYGDVPLIMSDEDLANDVERTPVSDIYDKAIVPSLTQAIEWLPETPRDNTNSRPSKWAAKTCLADVYITMAGWPLKRTECYALAAEAAKDVLDNNNYHELEINYEDLWKESNKNNKEFMFCLHHSQANRVMASNYGKSYYPADYYPNAGWADYYARAEAYENYPDDKRKDWNFMTEWPTKENEEKGWTAGQIIQWNESPDGLPCISKYYNYDQGKPGASAQANGVTCIYRLADAMLLYAEASTRATGQVNEQARQTVIDLQERAGYSERGIEEVPAGVSAEQFLNIVSDERSYEFFAEMRRWFELVRTEQVETKRADMWANSLFKAQNHYYFPIPYQQIMLTGWTNNPGY